MFLTFTLLANFTESLGEKIEKTKKEQKIWERRQSGSKNVIFSFSSLGVERRGTTGMFSFGVSPLLPDQMWQPILLGELDKLQMHSLIRPAHG